jgi:hypothetical protein
VLNQLEQARIPSAVPVGLDPHGALQAHDGTLRARAPSSALRWLKQHSP